MTNSPKGDVESKLRDKLRALHRTDHLDPRYPIDAYEDDLVALIEQEKKELLERLEQLCDDEPLDYDVGITKFIQAERAALKNITIQGEN